MQQIEKLEEMFALQNRLNTETSGDAWMSGLSKNGKTINWTRCIYMECCEAIDSFPWKHWKDINSDVDWENLKIEIIDIWHFFMSLGIEEFEKDKVTPIEMMKTVSNFKDFIDDKYRKKIPDNEEIIEKFESLIHKMTLKANNHFTTSVYDFLELGMIAGISFSEIYKLYIGKNCLNKIRQDNGYKEGKYIKNWNGKEDNQVMQTLLAQTPEITFDKLYVNLDNIYKRILNS